MNPVRIASLCLLLPMPLAGCERARPTSASPPGASPPASPSSAHRIAVQVDERGYRPDSVTVPVGQPVTLVFTRTSDEGCGQQVVFPSLNLRRDLPLNQPVEVTLTPTAGAIAFTCGMNMMRGSVVAQ